MKTLFYLIAACLCISQGFSETSEQNLEEFGFSTAMEKYRQQVSQDMGQTRPTVTNASQIPSPVLPRLETNYSDLVPPPTKPVSRKYYQPRFKDNVPDSKQEYTQDRAERIRSYKMPPDLNAFIDEHPTPVDRILGNTTWGLSGLHRTIDAEVLPKDTKLFFSGISHTTYDRSYGNKSQSGEITKFTVPIGVAATIYDKFEVALTGNIVNEESLGFPLLNDYEKTELEELIFMAKYQWMDNPQLGLKSAFGFGVQNANGKQVTRRGSDGTSFSGFVSITKNYGKIRASSQLGFTFAGGEDTTGNETPNTLFYNLGFETPISSATRFIMELNGLDWAGYGNNLDLSIGARYKVREEFNVELFIPVNIINSTLPYDYSYYTHAGVTIKM
jgi:hypothetical protein